MADTYTPNLGMTLCEIGASRDSWGTKWNANLTTIDQLLFQATPIGMIADFAGPNAPAGWLIADGRLISRTTYSALFAVIGTYWGAGDGSTTFALPNTNGRSMVGPGAMTDQAGFAFTFTFTTAQGFAFNVITQTTLPNYALSCDVQGFHSHGGATVGAGAHSHITDSQGLHIHPGSGDHIHSGYTDIAPNHTHGYSGAQWGSGQAVAGAASSLLNLFGGQTDPGGVHSHNIQTYNSGALFISADGSHGHNVYGVGDHVHGINGDGDHAHTVLLNGAGQPFEVLSPILVVTKIIYAGTQASTFVDIAAVPTTIEGEVNEIAALRQEIAELRALFAPPRRVPSTPLRGTH